MSRATEIDVKVFMKQNRKIKMLDKNLEYVTPREYATLIKSHYVTVYKWLKNGQVEGAVKVGGRWKIPVLAEDKARLISAV